MRPYTRLSACVFPYATLSFSVTGVISFFSAFSGIHAGGARGQGGPGSGGPGVKGAGVSARIVAFLRVRIRGSSGASFRIIAFVLARCVPPTVAKQRRGSGTAFSVRRANPYTVQRHGNECTTHQFLAESLQNGGAIFPMLPRWQAD